jgi:LPXTG-motif cell wall-anchored protein
MPQSDQNATSTSTQTTDKTTKSTTTTSDQNATADTNANADQNANGKKLPQTATPLPLLALLGMGSLTSGIVARFRNRK